MVATVWAHSGESFNQTKGEFGACWSLLRSTGMRRRFCREEEERTLYCEGDGNYVVPYPTYPQHHGQGSADVMLTKGVLQRSGLYAV